MFCVGDGRLRGRCAHSAFLPGSESARFLPTLNMFEVAMAAAISTPPDTELQFRGRHRLLFAPTLHILNVVDFVEMRVKVAALVDHDVRRASFHERE